MGGLAGLLHLLRRLAGSAWARALVSAGLLALVLSQIHLGRAGDRLSHGHWGLFVAAAACVLAALVLAGFRWHLFLEAGGIDRTRSEAVRAYLIGAFTTNFLPSQIGGDLTRALIAGRPGTRARALATVVVDRATLLGCLLVLGWAVYAENPGPVPGSLVGAFAAATAALAGAGLLATALVVGGQRLGGRLPERLRGSAREARDGLRACIDATLLGRTTLLGLVYQALILLQLWLCAQALGIHVAFSVLAATLPPVLILATLPISIGGYGVRESGFVVLLGRAGVSATDATLLSLSTGVTYALATSPGAALLWLRRPTGSVPSAQADQAEQERREEDLDAGDEGRRRENREPLH